MLIVAGRLRCRGLTLIELVVVLTILVALGAIVIPLLGGDIEIDLDGAGGADAKSAQEIATETTLARVAQAIVGPGGYAETMRYVRDPNGADGVNDFIGEGSGLPWPSDLDMAGAGGRENHPQLVFLFEPPDGPAGLGSYDPVSKLGWRGPWLSFGAEGRIDIGVPDEYGEDGDPTPLDAWGSPVVIQWPDEDSDGVLDDDERYSVRLVSAGENGQIDTPNDEKEPSDFGDDLVLYLFRANP
jgi:prepilin-type N-terminal cleavage/methylation domain-containing protein